MTTESGDNKLIGNFRKLIDELTADAGYNPANAKLKILALEAQYTAADAAVDAVAAALAPNKLAITNRDAAFKALRALVVRSRNYLKASGAPKAVVDDAETFVRKLTGGRVTPKVKANPATPQGELAKSRSASQMSFDNQLGNFQAYIEILKNVPEYNPNEPDLKTTALEALAADLNALNNAVSTTTATLNQKRGTRDSLLYLDDDCVVNTAKSAKAYVQASQGTKSQLYKQIKGLEFARQRKG